MKKPMKRMIAALLAAVLLVGLAACTRPAAKEADGPALTAALLEKIVFASPLEDVGDSAILYFANLPEDTQVKLYTGSGYFADEVALLTLAKAADAEAVRASVQNHIAQIRSQFANYIPAELGKIDKAVIWEGGKYIILCITDDHANAKKLLDSGDPAYKVTDPAPTAPTTLPTTFPTTLPTTLPPTLPTTQPTGTTGTTNPTGTTGTTQPTTTQPTVPSQGYDENGYPILMSQNGTYKMYDSGILRVDNFGFELCGYDDGTAATYAALVNKVADKLAGTAKVYCLPIPTGYGIMLPNDIRTQQAWYADPVLSVQKLDAHLNNNVITVHCADKLMRHRNEYLYFRTDHHWNGRGAYYAYEAFCQTKGIQPYTLDQRQLVTFDGFLGTLYINGEKDQAFLPADTVYAYKPYSTNASMIYYDTKGDGYKWPIVCDVTNYGASNKYLTFAAGDQPLAVFTNPDVKDGSVCIVVKESFGNALMPFLVDHYSTVYEIDYRYWSGDLAAYAQQVGADDVIFANNLGMIATSLMIAKLAKIVK